MGVGRAGGEGLTANDKTLPRFAVTPIPIEGLENLRCLQLQHDFLQQATGYDREKRKRTSRFGPYSTISIHFPQTSFQPGFTTYMAMKCARGSDLRMCRYPGNHWFESAPPKGARGRLGMVEDQVLLTVKIYRPVKKDQQQPTLTLNNTRCLQVWSLTQQLFRWLLQSRILFLKSVFSLNTGSRFA